MSDNIADVSMEEYLNQSDLSDQEDAEEIQLTPFHIDWLDLMSVGCSTPLGISELPDCLKESGVVEVFSLCTNGELYLCRNRNLRKKLREEDFKTHFYGIEDGYVPEIEPLVKLIEEIKTALMAGRKTLIHCHGDGGRSSVVAVCLLLQWDDNLSVDDAIAKVEKLRSKPALPSVKQYNFVKNGFRGALIKYLKEKENSGENGTANNESDKRSLSR